MNESRKPTICFVPHYIGSLKYFEKISKISSENFSIMYLFYFLKKPYSDEMITHSSLNGYDFFSIESPRWVEYVFIGPLKFLINQFYYKKGVREFLLKVRPSKLVFVNDKGFYVRYLEAEAKKLGIETLLLQWALTYEGQNVKPIKKSSSGARVFLGRFYGRLKKYLTNGVVRIVYGDEFSFNKQPLGLGFTDKVGVINKHAYDLFVRNGVDSRKISIVGYADFFLAENIVSRLKNNPEEKIRIHSKYGLDLNKKTILVFGAPFHRKDIVILNDDEQRDYILKVLETIRNICSQSLYNIVLKIHPSESLDFYHNILEKDYILLDKKAQNEELIGIADLYIADNTTTNFMAMVMKKKAIFINLHNLPIVEMSAPYFGIKRFIKTYLEFENALSNYRINGILEISGETEDNIIVSGSKERILNWLKGEK